MANRNGFFSKVKQFYSDHADTIEGTAIVVVAISVFIGGYIVLGVKSKTQPTTESNLAYYEQIARDVYENGGKAIVGIPDEVSVMQDNTSITVSGQGTDKVVANFKNGELLCTREVMGDIERIVKNLGMGIFAVTIVIIFYEIGGVIIYCIYKEIYRVVQKVKKLF